MRDAFLLGAGFSKAIWPQMPTMNELFQRLEPLIEHVDGFSKEVYDYARGNVETLLSYYAIPSPCDDHIEVLRKRRCQGRSKTVPAGCRRLAKRS